MPSIDIQTDSTLTHVFVEQRLAIAKEAALAAGKIQLDAYGKPLEIHTKSSDIDLVTQVDIACDQVIRDIISASFPQDTLITEETMKDDQWESSLNWADYTWIVDPLDGTTNFAHNFPHFAVSIACLYQGRLMVGVVYDVIKDELFYAAQSQGAFLEKPLTQTKQAPVRLSVSKIQNLEKSLLATGFPYDVGSNPRNNLRYFEAMLKRCHGVRRPGAAALDLAYVASGRLEGFWEMTLSPWDLAAGVLLIEEAGGACVDLNGSQLDFKQRRINIVTANSGSILAQMQHVLAKAVS